MTLALSTLPARPPAPTGATWLPPARAAERLGVSPRRVQQRANDEWLASGLARFTIGENGRLTLEIRSDADPLLSRVIAPEDMSVDLRTLTYAQRIELGRRMRIYQGWLDAIAAAARAHRTAQSATEEFLLLLSLDDGTKITQQTLYRWHRAFRLHGQAGLCDGRWKIEGDSSGPDRADKSDPFLAEVQRLWLTKRKLSKAQAHFLASVKAAEEGWTVVPIRTTGRFLDRIPVATVALYREGEEGYKNSAATFIERDYSTIDTNSMWVSDHHRLDVVVRHGGKTDRPWLTAFMDMRSRVIVGWRIFMHDPNSDTIIAAFRDGCMAFGVPDAVYFDHGKDFECEAIEGVTKAQKRRAQKPLIDSGIMGQLGIAVKHALPYNPQSKPIERFFRTVSEQFSKLWATYCGRSPEHKPDDLVEKVKRGLAPTMEQFVASFSDYLVKYHDTAHAGDGMEGRAPLVVFDAHLQRKRVLTDDLADLILMKKSRPLKVGQHGVTWQGVNYGSRQLAQWHGKQVCIRIDDRDVSSVEVFSYPEDKRLCTADSNERLPVNADAQLVREANMMKRRDLKLARAYHSNRPRLADTPAERMHRASAAIRRQQAAQPAPGSGAALAPVRHALEAALPGIRWSKQDRGGTATGGGSNPLIGRKTTAFDEEAEEGRTYRDPLLDFKSAVYESDEDGGDRQADLNSVLRYRAVGEG